MVTCFYREVCLVSKYSESGVDIDAANEVKKRIGKIVSNTWGEEVLSEVGNFGGLFALPGGIKDPVLVSSTDGVGTKLKVAFMAHRHDTVGQDLVNHCVNDILVQGARPLFFLDYLATGKLKPETVEQVIKGLAKACAENSCALIGGETAEMPGFYAEGEYDLAGTIVGIVERNEVVDGSTIEAGDVLWAFPSSGLHTNGYSLARKIIFEKNELGIYDELPGTGRSVADELLEVHRSYLKEVASLGNYAQIKGIAHITGGGLLENIPRILPEGVSVEIDASSWQVPAVFEFLRSSGGVEKLEMYRVFNMGVGLVVIVPPDDEGNVPKGEYRWRPFPIGRVVEGQREVKIINV
ncbi:phosphoribosylformylglycinamidine cyclo-ligase [bacterium]|nr:MAG: phosphoribosylformylglycinamidine cyclo-ligase [bacterium]